jgi:hypothetical protein
MNTYIFYVTYKDGSYTKQIIDADSRAEANERFFYLHESNIDLHEVYEITVEEGEII